jgi:hypothetical protein
MGHAVPMPISLRTRQYDEAFYQAMGAPEASQGPEIGIRDLFGED